MYLEAKVQSAKWSMFYDGIEMDVVDRQVMRPAGGRPQWKVKITRNWQGLAELKQMKKDKAEKEDLEAFAAGIPLPQEDEVIPLIIVDLKGKAPFQMFIAEVAQP